MRTVFQLVAAATIALVSASGGAEAIEPAFEPIPTEPPMSLTTPSTWPFDVSFGASFTTNYISRGITQTGNEAAIQGYVEPSIGPVYLNVWSSNVNFGADFKDAEIDTALGVRPEFGPLKFDLGYVHTSRLEPMR